MKVPLHEEDTIHHGGRNGRISGEGLPTKSPGTGKRLTVRDLRSEVIGVDTRAPLLDGTERPYVFLDNAASTPAFRSVLKCIEEFLPWYSGVHRGTGFKSLLSTEVFDRAHDLVGNFVRADLATNTVIFTKNTTECINKLSNRFNFGPDDVVITTIMEHHSNDLPWRKRATIVYVGVTRDGHPDLAGLKKALKDHAGRVRLVAINGASNITGICPPIHDIAEWVHAAGARIFVDAAQLAPHRPIDVMADDDPRHIDFLALSAHKMYAPFGTGALIGPRDWFEVGDPDIVGGGVVDVVTLDTAVWNHPPHKEEAGSPNVVGGVALAKSVAILESVGMDQIVTHERELLKYAYTKLRRIDGVTLYGPTEDLSDKVGVIIFNVEGKHHALVAAIIGAEGGIGVRNGCFCAHPYVKTILGITPEQDKVLTAEVLSGNKSNMPGMVRASIGCYNNESDIDQLADILQRIVHNEYKGRYIQDRASGAFQAQGYTVALGKYFPFLGTGGASGKRDFSEAS
jgi:selenocysteine lyase/cysteine desulfurase